MDQWVVKNALNPRTQKDLCEPEVSLFYRGISRHSETLSQKQTNNNPQIYGMASLDVIRKK